MPITLDTPIQIAAQPARVADKLWLLTLNIMAPSPTAKVRVTAVLVPYVSSTGELLRDKVKTLVLDDVLTKAATDTQLGATIETIFAEVDRQARAAGLF
jgi:hypothetical protein